MLRSGFQEDQELWIDPTTIVYFQRDASCFLVNSKTFVYVL